MQARKINIFQPKLFPHWTWFSRGSYLAHPETRSKIRPWTTHQLEPYWLSMSQTTRLEPPVLQCRNRFVWFSLSLTLRKKTSRLSSTKPRTGGMATNSRHDHEHVKLKYSPEVWSTTFLQFVLRSASVQGPPVCVPATLCCLSVAFLFGIRGTT